jgi:undecaprenyl-diphosphatase
MKSMSLLAAILLGAIEGITEFLPVSSTGHLTIVEKLIGLPINRPDVTAFTAIIQIGAIAAVFVYFRADITRMLAAWFRGLLHASDRNQEYRFAWAVIVGSAPIAVVGLALRDIIEHNVRSLWIVATALILWSFVMLAADRVAAQKRTEDSTSLKDALIIGVVQCIALIPGVSRSGATISAGLFRGFDRVAATRLSFFLSIPALTAAGIFEAITKAGDISTGIGWLPTAVATITSFIVAYASIAWLLKYVSKHNYSAFIVYRICLGLILIGLLASGVLQAT